MRVHSTFNNTLSVHQKASQQAEKGAIVEGRSDKSTQSAKNQPLPPKENLSRSQILARLKNKNQETTPKEVKAEPEQVERPEDKRSENLKRAPWDVEDMSEEKMAELNKQANEKARKMTALREGVKVTEIKEGEPIGDVGANRPDDPLTRSKLKEALDMGSFQFSEKEREVLSGILKD